MSTEQRLLATASKRFEPDETMEAWCRTWVAREAGRPWRQRFSARWRDFLVVTDRRVMLFSARHFTRRPHHRVLADRIDNIVAEVVPRRRGTRVRLAASGHSRAGNAPTVLVLDLGAGPRATTVAERLGSVAAPKTIEENES